MRFRLNPWTLRLLFGLLRDGHLLTSSVNLAKPA